MSNFDPTLPVQTRDGRKARIICTDAVGEEGPVIVLIFEPPKCDEEILFYYDNNFKALGLPRNCDLVNTPAIPKGLRGFAQQHFVAEEREWLHMDQLIDYLDKEELFVGPKHMTSVMCSEWHNDGRATTAERWTAAIKAWEEET